LGKNTQGGRGKAGKRPASATGKKRKSTPGVYVRDGRLKKKVELSGGRGKAGWKSKATLSGERVHLHENPGRKKREREAPVVV